MSTWNSLPRAAFDLETTGRNSRSARIVTASVTIVDQHGDVIQDLFDAGTPVIAFNASYDFTVLAAESARYGVPQLTRFPVLDPYIMNKQVDRYRKGKRTLTALCEEYGVVLDNAHTSAADALATLKVLDAMAGKFPKLRMPASQLHQLQVDWAVSQAADFQSYLRKTKPAAVIEGDWPVLPPQDASVGGF